MSKLMNDGRQAAQEVNNMMAEMDRQRQLPKVEGEVEYHRHGLIFSHFDSRGGSCLMLGEENIIKAMKKYNELCGWEEDDNTAFQDLNEGSAGHVEILVVGRQLPDDGDVLASFAEDGGGFICFKVKQRMAANELHPATDWMDAKAVILVAVDAEYEIDNEMSYAPSIPKVTRGIANIEYEYELEFFDPGEDACGLCLMR